MNNMSIGVPNINTQLNTTVRDNLFCIYGLALTRVHDTLLEKGKKITYNELLSACPVMSEYPNKLTKSMFVGAAKYLSNTFHRYLSVDCKMSDNEIEVAVSQAVKSVLNNIKQY